MTEKKSRPMDNAQAIRIVGLIGEVHQGEVPAEAERAALVRELARAFDTKDTPCPSDGEAAAAALELLAQDPRLAGPIEAAQHGPRTKAFGFGVVEGTVLMSGLLVALQTHFEFERDKDGRWSIKIRKKPTSDALLKPLVKKLVSLLGIGNSGD